MEQATEAVVAKHTGDTFAVVDGKTVPIPQGDEPKEEVKDDAPAGEAKEPDEKTKDSAPADGAEPPDATAEDGPEPSEDEKESEEQRKKNKHNTVTERLAQYARRTKDAEGKIESAEMRAEKAEARARELEAKYGESIPEKNVKTESDNTNTPPGAPKMDDYGTITEWIQANNEWIRAEAKREAREELEKTKAEAAKAATEAELAERVEKAEKKHPNFVKDVLENEYLRETLGANAHLGIAVTNADNFADLAVHLKDNPDVLEGLAAMPVTKALMEIGKLDATFDRDKGNQEIPTKTRTSAPPPPPTLGAGGDSGAVDMSKLSTKEWMKRRMAQKEKG